MTRSMDPIFWLSAPKTGVPSTLSLPIRLLVSLVSVAIWHLQDCEQGYEQSCEIKKTGVLGDCSGRLGGATPASPRTETSVTPNRDTTNTCERASRVIRPGLLRDDEVATFGYPRERSF